MTPRQTYEDGDHGRRTRRVEVEPKPRMSHVRLATILGLVVVVALAGLVGWLGFRAYESHKTAEQQRSLFLQVGRQGALNLTTIDFEHADADVQRILDSATGTFYDDFSKRVAAVRRRRQAGAVEVRRHHHRGGPGIRDRRPGRRCSSRSPSRRPTPVPPNRRRGRGGCGSSVQKVGDERQGLQRGVRAVTENTARAKTPLTRNDGCDEVEPPTAAQAAEATEADGGEASYRRDADEPTKPATRADRCRRAHRSGEGTQAETDWSRVVAFAMLPASRCILALGGGFLKWQDCSVRDADTARTESVQAAKDCTIPLLSYKPDTVEQQLTDARGIC